MQLDRQRQTADRQITGWTQTNRQVDRQIDSTTDRQTVDRPTHTDRQTNKWLYSITVCVERSTERAGCVCVSVCVGRGIYQHNDQGKGRGTDGEDGCCRDCKRLSYC